MKKQTNLITFRHIYTYLNEDTLNQALNDGRDDLLVNMLKEKLGALAISCILIALGESLNAKYISLLWRYTKQVEPLIRESTYIALSCYPDQERPQYNYFLTNFKNNLMTEKSYGVRKRLEQSIEWFEEVEGIL